MRLLGRRQIFTDKTHIDKSNILEVIAETFQIHEINRQEILYLMEYSKGSQPILHREKKIRPEINEKIVDNIASEILEFKIGYEFGSPITYVQRARNDIKSSRGLIKFFKNLFTSDESHKEDLRVSALNEMMAEENKAAKDIQLAKDIKTCGVGYRLVLPKRFKDGVSVFDVMVLNPMNTYVVYTNNAYREPILGVSYFPRKDGSCLVGCYTKESYFEIERRTFGEYEKTFVEKANIMGEIPIIEYINDYDRMGCFERVIPLIDALNTIDSDRVNSIAQHVQSILWGDNIAIDKQQYQELREDGMIVTKSEQGKQATLKYLESVLNQTENQTLVDYIKDQIQEITQTPSRSELSGGSTGSATNMSTGWMAAETDAKQKEQIFTESAKRETKLVLKIIKSSNEVDADIAELNLSDIEIRFSRSRTYDLATKCNSLATLIHIGIDPLRAIETVGLFTDPQQVALDSGERIDRILFKESSTGNNQNAEPYKKTQPDVTDQPSSVTMAAE